MAPSSMSDWIVLLLAFAVPAAATLQPSGAARVQGIGPAVAVREPPEWPILAGGPGVVQPAAEPSPSQPSPPPHHSPRRHSPLPHPSSPPPEPSSPPPQPEQSTAHCVGPLVGLWPCLEYLAGSARAPPGSCCDAFNSLVGDSADVCLCYAVRGNLSSLITSTIDPVRMLFLPVTCSTTKLPLLELLFKCFMQPVPPLMAGAAIDGS